MKERQRQPRRNEIDFDILRFSIRRVMRPRSGKSAVRLGCGLRPRKEIKYIFSKGPQGVDGVNVK